MFWYSLNAMFTSCLFRVDQSEDNSKSFTSVIFSLLRDLHANLRVLLLLHVCSCIFISLASDLICHGSLHMHQSFYVSFDL